MGRRLLKIFSILFIAGLTLELGAYFIVKQRGWAPQGYKHDLANEAAGRHSYTLPQKVNPFKNIRQPHPFFGHRMAIGNNHGFIHPFDFPLKDNAKKRIGIFGGSTAMHWAEWMQEEKFFASSGIKDWEIVNYGISGMKQPQQFAVAVRFIQDIDVAIFYDGFNEAVFNTCPNDPEYPVSFNLMAGVHQDNEKRQKLITLSHKLKHSSNYLYESFLGNSSFVFVLWKTYATQIKKSLADIRKQNSKIVLDQFAECNENIDDRKYRIWKKYSGLGRVLAQHYSIPYFHLMQIDPFKKGAKLLSEQEKKIVSWYKRKPSNNGSIGEATTEFYNRYLNDKPSYSRDISFLFSKNQEVLFIDEHTHMNAKGYELLSKELIRILKVENIIK